MYAILGESIGKLESSFYNFAIGTIILGIALLFWGKVHYPLRLKHQNGN